MYSRTNSVTLAVQKESFAFSRMATRSTEPEVFTFERVPPQATAVHSFVPIRPKKRCTRVMYPAKVRMHLPPPERSQAKRWLLILCLVVLWQIYTEEPCLAEPAVDASASDYHSLSFPSAVREQQRGGGSELLSSAPSMCEHDGEPTSPDTTCPKPAEEPESSRPYEQSAGKGYMVALLVYHRLGSDN